MIPYNFCQDHPNARIVETDEGLLKCLACIFDKCKDKTGLFLYQDDSDDN